MNHIDNTASLIKYSVLEGHNRWKEISNEKTIEEQFELHKQEVTRCKNFLSERMKWLKEEFDKM